MNWQPNLRTVLAGAALIIAGCGPKSLPALEKPFPVRGKVLLPGGQPLQGGQVTFYPFGDAVVGRFPAFGFPGKDGTFELMAYKEPGVPAGKYKVVIAPRDEGDAPGSNSARIPKVYQSRDTTPIQVDVQAQENNLEPFVLK
jgi:hypothetical protein